MADDLESAVQQKRKESSAGGKKKVKKAAAGKKKKVTKKKDSGAGEKYFIKIMEGANNKLRLPPMSLIKAWGILITGLSTTQFDSGEASKTKKTWTKSFHTVGRILPVCVATK